MSATPTPTFDPRDFARWSSEVQDLIIEKIEDARGAHLETAIAGACALAGCLILRSTGVLLAKLPPGSPGFVEAIDAPASVHMGFLMEMGTLAGLESNGSWSDSVPVGHQPLKSVFELINLLEAPFAQLCDSRSIPGELRSRLALFTAARLIASNQEVLRPEIGKAVATWAFVSGAKTVPPRGSDPKPFWKRLFR